MAIPRKRRSKANKSRKSSRASAGGTKKTRGRARR